MNETDTKRHTLDDIVELVGAMDKRLDRMFDHVILATGNEKTDTAHGYVIGKQSDGRPTIWLYGHDKLSYKLVTIWSEDFDSLPFEVDASVTFPSSAAPKRSEAIMSPYWREFSEPLEFVKKASGKKSEKGDLVFDFSHFVGSEPTSDVPVADVDVGVDVAAIRAAAVKAKTLDEFCDIVRIMYDDLFDESSKIKMFCQYIVPSTVVDPDRGALLAAFEAYAARMAMGTKKRAAANAAKKVYEVMT